MSETARIIIENIKFHLTLSSATLAGIFAFLGAAYPILPTKWIVAVSAILLGGSLGFGTIAFIFANNELIAQTYDFDRVLVRYTLVAAIVCYFFALVIFVSYCGCFFWPARN